MSVAAANGTGASMWAQRRDDSPSTNWGGSRESGAAFRGISTTRGRGRGGGRMRAGGRGGRAASDRSAIEKGELQRPSNRSDKPISAINSSAKPSGSNGIPSDSGNTTVGRDGSLQLNSRKEVTGNKTAHSEVTGSRDSPAQGNNQRSATLKHSGGSFQSNSSTTSSSSSKSSTRRRRSGGRKSSLSVKPPKSLTTSLAPPVPPVPVSALKDLNGLLNNPEPFTPIHDVKQDVDSLVEHVRTMAMEGNRSSSPATHIDWAGEDDDSLPDLEDWGISSKKVSESSDDATKVEEPIADIGKSTTVSDAGKIADTPLAPPIGPNARSSAIQEVESSPSADSSLHRTRGDRSERKRERGRGRDKDKKATSTNSTASAVDSDLQTSTTPRKGLLERISSPVRPAPISVSNQSEKSPSRVVNGANEVHSPASTLPFHPSLPPKPLTSPFPESPRRPNASHNKPSSPWRQRHDEVLKTVNALVADASNAESAIARSNPRSIPQATQTSETVKIENIEVSGKSRESDTMQNDSKESSSAYKDSIFLATSHFDWSDEPTSFDQTFPVKLDVEPPTPHDELPTTPSTAPVKSSLGSPSFTNSRSRAQRPLSGDITPRSRRDRSPHKTHNARNHSAPSAGGLGPSRTRAPHATRPVIRMDALAMISRSLRESPTPPRRESPAPTAVSTTE